jgi:hypothetical protein
MDMAKEKAKPLYVGMGKNLQKRIISNHCQGDVNSSVLRKTIAKLFGLKIDRFKRDTGKKSSGYKLNADFNGGEKKISEYIQGGEWQFIECESPEEAADFELFVIEKLRPVYNHSYNHKKEDDYMQKFDRLISSKKISYVDRKDVNEKPGVYVFYHREIKLSEDRT